jgi:hypothetical protein
MQLVPRQSAQVDDNPLSDLAEYVKCRCIQNIHMAQNSILPLTMLMGTQVLYNKNERKAIGRNITM